ncbi:MAG TPA: sialidase family protein [Acidimicrobiales bacterium]|nr:sialidase family protein [Acidimicrobiales bacterium]
MTLVDSTSSPFQSVGGGPQTGDLICVTASTCYASQSGPGGLAWEVTDDGGVSWHALAALPNGRHLSAIVSCPAARTCIGVDGPSLEGGSGGQPQPELAWTSDGGGSWRLDPLPVPAREKNATIEQLSCPTVSDCVAFLSGSSSLPDFFMTTKDGGATWTSSGAPAGLSGLWSLRCEPSGACIGLVPYGSVRDPSAEGIVALRSDDFGASWETTSTPMPFGPGILHLECADALHCIMASSSDGGTSPFTIVRTSDGGQTWITSAAPSAWPALPISVSCADGEDCYLSASAYTRGGYDDAVLEVTHDGGASWTSLQLPHVDGRPLALVYPLSCPVAAGCIGVGATIQEFDTPPQRSSPPDLTAPSNKDRVIISNLQPASGS